MTTDTGIVPAGAFDVAVGAARDAGSLLRELFTSPRTIDYKGDVDLVTDADRASETQIAHRLRQAFPDHSIVGEEGIATTASDSSWTWAVDPLDGTTNYAHGYPHFAVSIALVGPAGAVVGVVYDPMRDELFAAQRGAGATCNGRPIQVTGETELVRSLLSTGFSYELNLRDGQLMVWNRLESSVQSIRRDGAAAIDLVWVAAGRLDGFYEAPLQPWDMAAGGLIVEEAGGRVTAYDGRPFDPLGRGAIASNGGIHEALLRVVVGG